MSGAGLCALAYSVLPLLGAALAMGYRPARNRHSTGDWLLPILGLMGLAEMIDTIVAPAGMTVGTSLAGHIPHFLVVAMLACISLTVELLAKMAWPLAVSPAAWRGFAVHVMALLQAIGLCCIFGATAQIGRAELALLLAWTSFAIWMLSYALIFAALVRDAFHARASRLVA